MTPTLFEAPKPRPIQVGAGRWRHRKLWKIAGPRRGPLASLCLRILKQFSFENPSVTMIEGEVPDKETLSFEGSEEGYWVLTVETIVTKPDL